MQKKKGIIAINVVNSYEREHELRVMGCEHVLNQNDADFSNKLASLSDQLKATTAFDCVLGKMAITIARSMKENSLIISYGSLGDGSYKASIEDEKILHRHEVHGFSSINWLNKQKIDEREKLFTFMRNTFNDLFKPRIEATHSWKDYTESIVKAHEHLNGKKILIFPD